MLLTTQYDIRIKGVTTMKLTSGITGTTYTICGIQSGAQDIENLLHLMGCCKGENITLESNWADSCDIFVRDGRYNIEKDLADRILIAG